MEPSGKGAPGTTTINKLRHQHKLFAEAYLETGSPTESARRAGYGGTDANIRDKGHDLMKNPDVAAYVAKRMEELDGNRIADSDSVLAFLTSVMHGQVVDEIPILAGDGTQRIDQIVPAARDRVKAAELLGKRYALFTDRQHIEGAMSVMIVDDVPSGATESDE